MKSSMSEPSFLHSPKLKAPYMVIGLGGWLNAAEVATGVVGYLVRKLGARRFAEISPWEFYNFTVLRPVVVSEAGVVQSLTWPANDFYCWENQRGGHDLILLRGQEPHLRWKTYVDLVLQVARRFEVSRVYLVGGFFAAVPHTREPGVSAGVSHPHLKAELEPFEVAYADYQGPTGVTSMLRLACREADIEAVSLSGQAPHYITAANPKVCHAILKRLVVLLGIEVDLEPIRMAGEHLDDVMGKALAENAGLQRYIAMLEDGYEQALEQRGPGPALSDRIIREIEELLKRQRGEGGGETPEG